MFAVLVVAQPANGRLTTENGKASFLSTNERFVSLKGILLLKSRLLLSNLFSHSSSSGFSDLQWRLETDGRVGEIHGPDLGCTRIE